MFFSICTSLNLLFGDMGLVLGVWRTIPIFSTLDPNF